MLLWDSVDSRPRIRSIGSFASFRCGQVAKNARHVLSNESPGCVDDLSNRRNHSQALAGRLTTKYEVHIESGRREAQQDMVGCEIAHIFSNYLSTLMPRWMQDDMSGSVMSEEESLC